MPKSNLPLEKVTLRLFLGDSERMNQYYTQSGYNKAIRTLVHKHLKILDEKVNAKKAELQAENNMGEFPEVDLNERTDSE